MSTGHAQLASGGVTNKAGSPINPLPAEASLQVMPGPRKKRGDDEAVDDVAEVDPAILAAIRQVVKEEMDVFHDRLEKIDESIKKLLELRTRVDEVERSVQDTSDKMEQLMKDALPSLANHVARVSEALARQTLNIDVHRRKWNMIIHGVDGAAEEPESVTRASCIKFAKDVLKVKDVENCHLAACHRLSRKANAGIIVRFCDLRERDRWFSGTSNLKNVEKNISVSPDIPPILRPMKDRLMMERKALPPNIKAKSKVRFLPAWPFMELRIEKHPTIRPKETLSDITRDIVGFDHHMKFAF